MSNIKKKRILNNCNYNNNVTHYIFIKRDKFTKKTNSLWRKRSLMFVLNFIESNKHQNPLFIKIHQASTVKHSLINFRQLLWNAVIQPKEWVLGVINMILNEKMISEIYEEHEKIPKTSLKIYVIEWFLKTFGSREIAVTLLKDFLLTLRVLYT